MKRIGKRPFWAAPRLRRKFGAKRRIAQGRLCRPEHFNAEGWSRSSGGGTQKEKSGYRTDGTNHKKALLDRTAFAA